MEGFGAGEGIEYRETAWLLHGPTEEMKEMHVWYACNDCML